MLSPRNNGGPKESEVLSSNDIVVWRTESPSRIVSSGGSTLNIRVIGFRLAAFSQIRIRRKGRPESLLCSVITLMPGPVW